MEGLDWQTFQLPFGLGLDQKADDRALAPPALAIASDVEFDDLGGLSLRHPYTDLGLFLYGGGGSSLTNPRKIVAFGDELLLFTKDALYSYNAQQGAWVSRSTHLAAEIEEESRFVTTDDQIAPDRAELAGVVFFSWHKVVAGNTTGYVAAVDKTTGAVVLPPYELVGYQRIRLTALSTKVLLTFYDGLNGIYGYALDPASPSTALGGASTTISSSAVVHSPGPFYDIVKIPGADQAAFAVGAAAAAAYTVGTVTAGMVVARTSKARANTSAIAVSCEPTGTSVQVIRGGGAGTIVGDLITISTRADVYTGQSVGTHSGTLNQIAAAHRSVQDSAVYRCYAFWSAGESASSTTWQSQYNWVSTGNTLGTAATFVRMLGIGSRAFDHDGRVFVWTAFAGESTFSGVAPPAFRSQLQNTFFLYRDDAFLAAKAARSNAGGFAALTGSLPGVQSLGSGVYAFAGTERRIIPLGERQSGYGARAPREIKVTFDSDAARRCVRLGQTLYVTGGELLQYDGVSLTEVGFHLYPHYFGGIEVGTGNLADGTYAYKVTWRWDNAAGELDRSTTATTGEVTIAGGPNGVSIIDWTPLHVTHKTSSEVAVEAWRTAVNPTADAPFYLITSKDPAALTNPNRYTPNLRTASAVATLNDELADDDLTTLESNPENGAVLENLAPPACTIIAADADRVFLAGVAGDPHRVWYSKLREDGQVAAFNDALTVAVPPTGGVITALAFLNETLIVFKETAIYALPGDGFDNVGGGSNYGPARLISSDVGATNAESVALTPSGLVFSSAKGKYLLGGSLGVQYIGGAVRDYDAETVLAVHVLETKHQIRWVTASRVLVLDYLAVSPSSPVGQWCEWTITGALGACLWGGVYAYLTTTGVATERTTFAGVAYSLDVETAWIKMSDLQGAGRVRRFLLLGEYRASHYLRVRVSRDYQTTPFMDDLWTPSPTTVGGPLQVSFGPTIQRCQAFKVRITVGTRTVNEGSGAVTFTTGSTEGVKLTGLGLEVGLYRGLHRRLPAAQKA